MSISYSYADDILIFSSTSSSSLQSIMGVLRGYESVSDQKVNASKSRYLVHSNMSSSRRVLIERIKGFSFKIFLFVILDAHYLWVRGKRFSWRVD